MTTPREVLDFWFGVPGSPGLVEPSTWARKHHDVIDRFGRFPQRNAALSRESTREEIEFLGQPGSAF